MLEELIRNTFENRIVYHYYGKKSDLETILFSNSLSYNYIIDDKNIYFVTETPISHDLINLYHNPLESSGE